MLATTLLIYSRLLDGTTGFIVSHHSGSGLSGAIGDPWPLPLRPLVHTRQRRHSPQLPASKGGTNSLLLLPLISVDSSEMHQSSMDALEAEKPRVFQIFHMNHNLSLWDCVCLSNEGNLRDDIEFKRVPRGSRRRRASSLESCSIDDEHLVAKDFDEEQSELGTVNHEMLYSKLVRMVNQGYKKSRAVDLYEEMVERILEGREDMRAGVHTLADFITIVPPVNDIDRASQITHDLLNSIDEVRLDEQETKFTQQLKSLTLSTPEVMQILQSNIDEDQTTLLLPIYESLLRKWVSSLPEDVPSHFRVLQENIVRQVSIQLFLTSHGVQPVRSNTLVANQPDDPNFEATSFALPVRKRRRSSSAEIKRNNSQFQLQLQSQSRSQAVSSQPADSMFSRQQSQKDDLSQTSNTSTPLEQSLGQYCSFRLKEKKVSRSRRTEETADSLAGWQIGKHPKNIDWSEFVGDETSEEEQATMKRRGRKDKERERQSQATSDPSSLGPVTLVQPPWSQITVPIVSSQDVNITTSVPISVIPSSSQPQARTPRRRGKEGFR